MEEINSRIIDRSDCFYWQTDRKVTIEEAATIWKDRHSAIENDLLIEKINNQLTTNDVLLSINPFDQNAQTSSGNVNSIRVGVLQTGEEVVIRCHPKGVANGYFHVESLAAKFANESGVPSYQTYLIHDLENTDDIAYQVITKLPGRTIQYYLNDNPQKEEYLVYKMGEMLAKLHRIKVHGFGPFDNAAAKQGRLVGLHTTLNDAVLAGLPENLERLIRFGVITFVEAERIHNLFFNNPLLALETPSLIHNDFADWNLLTDGTNITGVVDWDECFAGHPVQELACWSVFFPPERARALVAAYFRYAEKPENFNELYQLFRLRYVISKLALRLARYNYEQSDFLKDLIIQGRRHLDELKLIFLS